MFDWLIRKFGTGIALIIIGVFVIIAALVGEFNLWIFSIPIQGTDIRMYVGFFGAFFIILGLAIHYFLDTSEIKLPPLPQISDWSWFNSGKARSGGNSPQVSVAQALVMLNGLYGSQRVRTIQEIARSLPNGISGRDAARLLGNLYGTNRTKAIRILSPKIQKRLSPGDTDSILGTLHGTDRKKAIEALQRR